MKNAIEEIEQLLSVGMTHGGHLFMGLGGHSMSLSSADTGSSRSVDTGHEVPE